jgi:hypothetical protein
MSDEKEKTISADELASFANGLDWDKCTVGECRV